MVFEKLGIITETVGIHFGSVVRVVLWALEGAWESASPQRPSEDTIYFDNFILADTLEEIGILKAPAK